MRRAGIPPRPLVLIVRALDRLYLLPPQRIAAVDPAGRGLVLWPDPAPINLRRHDALNN